MKTTLILNYQTEQDKTKFMEENKTSLSFDRIIFVNNRHADGVNVEFIESTE